LTTLAGFRKPAVVSEANQDPISSQHPHRTSPGVILVNTYHDLLLHEPEIVARINASLNGGNLFLAHPFQCLADLNVQLSAEVRAELIRAEPALSTLSLTAYTALKKSTKPEPVLVTVRGLFRKGKS
jgi:hypothetical protein